MSWPQSSAAKHFRMAKEGDQSTYVRTICGAYVNRHRTYELREGQVVDCPACMLVRDAWLELGPKRKPLTVRRCRQLWTDRFNCGWKPPQLESPLAQYNAKPKPPPTEEELAAYDAARAARKARIEAEMASLFEKAKADKAKDAVRLVARRQATVDRIKLRLKRNESLLRRATRRLKLAITRNAKLNPPDETTTQPTQH